MIESIEPRKVGVKPSNLSLEEDQRDPETPPTGEALSIASADRFEGNQRLRLPNVASSA
jgi:hypothetical protein